MGIAVRLCTGQSLILATVPYELYATGESYNLFSKAQGVGGQKQALPRISEADAEDRLKNGALFVDARDESEYLAGHIRRALSAPASDVSHTRLYLAGISKDQPIVVYCIASTCGKAEFVGNALADLGYLNVSIYSEGWIKWRGPTERGGS